MARTLAEIDADIAKYEAARDRALELQAFAHGTKSGQRPNLEVLERSLSKLRLERGRAAGTGGVTYVVPV